MWTWMPSKIVYGNKRAYAGVLGVIASRHTMGVGI